MEIKNYLFKNLYNNKKENIVKKIIKKNNKELFSKDNIFNKKQEASNSLFTHQNILKKNIFLNKNTNSSNNIINNSTIFNSYYQNQSSDKKNSLSKKKNGRMLNNRNLSQKSKISLNNKKKNLTSVNNTTATSLLNNQINNYNKCITDRNVDDNKNKNLTLNKLGNGSLFISKSKTLMNKKELKDSNYLSTASVIPKKYFGAVKKDSINNAININKSILKNKILYKDLKYQFNYNENNNTNNILNENILFKKKIKNYNNSNMKKLNNNKIKNQNYINLNEYKNKTINLLNIKKINLSNLPINFLDGKLIQGIMNLNNSNNNINNNTDLSTRRECITDRTNYNYSNTINSQIKNKEVINEQYNNINNNYIIANIINNIKLNNKKVKKKNISRNKSIKFSEKKNTIYNTNLTSLNLILKNTNLKNYPSLIRIKTIDINKLNNNKTPSIDYNMSFNKKVNIDNKNLNKKLFDMNNNLNINFNKKNNNSKNKKINLNIKFKKKGKNYKKLINVPLKLTKKNIFQKDKKLNLEMNYSNNSFGFDKLNLLTFNYIHSLNFKNKKENSLQNKRKLSQNNYSVKYRDVFQLFSINESKRDSNNNKTFNSNNKTKTNLIRNIPRNSKIQNSKYINSLSNYEIRNSNTINSNDHKNILNNKLSKNIINKKLKNKKPHSYSPFDINCILNKKISKKNNEILLHTKSRKISRNYKNYIGCFNNESKTNITKYKTNKSSKSKKGNNEKNTQNENTNNQINSKKRIKNLSVAICNANKSITNQFDNVIGENEKKQNSTNNIFSNIYQNNKNADNDKEDENELISVKINSKKDLSHQIQSTNSIKNKNQSNFSKKSRGINIPISSNKNKSTFKEDINHKEKEKEKEKNKNKEEKNTMIIDEYFDEIIYSLLKEESEFISKKLINHNYLLNTDKEISPEMRAMVVDWLLEVHQIFHFKEKCLFTTVQIIDKFLSKKDISIEQFQLLALTALNIASKQEEVEYPILDNFITISKNTITKKEMIDMENKVLSTINFEILSPSILDFFEIYACICNLNPVEISQGLYIMNIILIDINMLKFKSSVLAFAVLKLITKEENIKELLSFIKNISKKAYKINGKKNNEAQILLEEINKENSSNELSNDVKYLFRTILKTHYHNAKNKFNSQNFHAVSSYTSI